METEVKYLVDRSLEEIEEELKTVYKNLGYVGELDLPAIYYDTENGALEKKRAALRVRTEEGKLIGCYKAITSQERVFIEEEIELTEKDLNKDWFVRLKHYSEILNMVSGEELNPKVKINTKRRVYLLQREYLVLEIVLDWVDYLEGIFKEERVEVELKEGDLQNFEDFIDELEKKIGGLNETIKPKYQKAIELLKSME